MSDALRLSAALTFWLAAFSLVYGLQGMACALGWPGARWMGWPLDRVVLVGAWALVVVSQGAILLALRSPRLASPRPFVRRATDVLAVAALVASVWTLLPVAVTTTCL